MRRKTPIKITHFLSVVEVCAAANISRSTLWRMVREGRFPQPQRLTKRHVTWPVPVYEKWAKDPIKWANDNAKKAAA